MGNHGDEGEGEWLSMLIIWWKKLASAAANANQRYPAKNYIVSWLVDIPIEIATDYIKD